MVKVYKVDVDFKSKKGALKFMKEHKKLKPELEVIEFDEHLGCPSYPECDEMPIGCRKIMGKDVEMFGYRD